eukprot:1127001-Prymnesium_polylepis.1
MLPLLHANVLEQSCYAPAGGRGGINASRSGLTESVGAPNSASSFVDRVGYSSLSTIVRRCSCICFRSAAAVLGANDVAHSIWPYLFSVDTLKP